MENWIETKSKDGFLRYVLGEKGSNPLLIISAFPGFSTHRKLDIKVRKIKTMSKNLGFDGWMLVSLYPQRIKDIRKLDWTPEKCIFKNRQHIGNLIHKFDLHTIWAAWGDDISAADYMINELEKIHALELAGTRWISIGGVTQSGNPRHPGNINYQSKAENMDMDAYIEKNKQKKIK